MRYLRHVKIMYREVYNAKMTKQIICVMVNNLINLDKSQSWTLDLKGIHFEAIASNSDEMEALISFKIWQSVCIFFVIIIDLKVS